MFLTAGNLRVSLEQNLLKITNLEGHALVETREPALFQPRFQEQESAPVRMEIEAEDGKAVLHYFYGEEAPVKEIKVYLEEKGRYLEIYSALTPEKDVMLNAVALFPKKTRMPLYKAINFRNRHCTEQTWEDLPMGAEFSTTTYSTDWQFAPHPSMLLFSKMDYHFFLGAMTLPKTFGLYLDVDSYQLERLEESYGEEENGLLLKAGETFESTRYAFFVDYKKDPHDVIKHYTDLLVEAGDS